MKAVKAYVLVVLAVVLPIGWSLFTYDGRGGLLPYRMGMVVINLIAYGVLLYVVISTLGAFAETFANPVQSGHSRIELGLRFAVVVAVAIVPFVVGGSTQFEWTEEDLAKTSTINLDGTRYAIPVKYLYREWKQGGEVVSFELVALLPDMEPKTMNNKEEFTKVKDGMGRRIQITLRKYGKPHPDFLGKYGDYSNKAIYLQHELGLYRAMGLNKPIAQKYGLHFYGKRYSDELYIADDQSSGVYFTCGEDKEKYYPVCKTQVPYKGNVVLEYKFRKTYLKDWRSIQIRVLDLLKSTETSSQVGWARSAHADICKRED